MDVDSWSSRVKYFSSSQAGPRFNSENIVMDDDDENKAACFPCPFCYVDVEINVLCSHLQEEHCFDLKNAVCPLCAANLGKDAMEHFIVQHVCPLCAANLGKDAMEHFIVQHASSQKGSCVFQRRRKYPKSGFLTSHSVMLGKELSSFLGSSTNVKESGHESAPHPFLSPFLHSTSSGPKGIQQDKCSENSAPVATGLESAKQSLRDEDDERNKEEMRLRAAFVQGLIESTLFLDLHTS